MPLPNRQPAWWVPTLYFAEGLPYVMVNSVVGLALVQLGWSKSASVDFTTILSVPWIIKPYWSWLVEGLGTQRRWIVAMQAALALLLVPIAFFLPDNGYVLPLLGLLFALGLASATHDIAADGFYIAGLSENQQAEWSGIRNSFYRLAGIAGSGGLVWLAGRLGRARGLAPAWSAVFGVAAMVLALLAVYHWFLLPRPARVAKPAIPRRTRRERFAGLVQVWLAFLRKPGFGRILLFILLYRFAEIQVQKVNVLFFNAPGQGGGLGLSTEEVGLLYNTLGILALVTGGIAGGLAIARFGLRGMLWPMAATMNLPNILYVWMAWAQPHSRVLIGGVIAFEQFGYGFGFAAFMVYLLYVARGEHATAHYAICTGFMAMGVSLASAMAAEALKLTEHLPGGGYLQFFSWVMACALVSFAVLWKLPLEANFGSRIKN